MSSALSPLHGAGLGLRRDLMTALEAEPHVPYDFMEVAPENWMTIGGRGRKRFRAFTERHPFVCHGLSLSLGGPSPLDETFLQRLKRFLDEHQVRLYSEHLTSTSDNAHLYDLMPIPFTEAAVKHVAARIRRTQEILGRRMAIENASYYTPIGAEMREIDFINAVLEAADCDLLLDVNNIYVNSVNHRYDPVEFLHALPPARVAYIHVAGHYNEAPDLIVDTHGAAVIPNVWALLEKAYEHAGPVPTLLERDFNMPPLPELFAEIGHIKSLQAAATTHRNERVAHA